jgi:two-component system chemotaxis sensor kinase CheA
MSQPNPSQTFLVESGELLAQIEEIVLDMDPANPDPEDINRLFRAFHTIKGSGAMFGFDAVAAFTHHVETVLDQVREGSLRFSSELLRLVLAARDRIKALLDADLGDAPADPGTGDRIVAALSALGGQSTPAPAPTSSTLVPAPKPSGETSPRLTFRIRFRPDRSIMVSGTNPISLLNELRDLGDCTVVARTDAVPPLEELQPDQIHLAWEITLDTDRGANAIKDVFIFVEDGAELAIEPVATLEPPVDRRPAPAAPLEPPVPVSPASNDTAFFTRASTQKKPTAKDATVRVPSEKLDHLVNLVGELVMNQSRLCQVASRFNAPELDIPVEEIERLVSELRDNVLGIRMMPIGATFNRFKRLVHDLSAELGKEIALVTEGAETELDKTVLDQLGDPLVHLIRNSLDHGIESGDVRERSGKRRQGTIRLAAVHTGSNVVVTIQDDGKGLDTAAILAKAVEKRLVPPDASLTEKEIFNLIFLPGFSTAKTITSVSGRGVGMDVVKRQIDALRGSISIASQIGRGTTISLTLPLTLAIIEGLLVEIGRDQFIVPMSVVAENVELHRSERGRNNGRNVVAVRGDLVPYIHLRELFGQKQGEPELQKIVVVRHEDQRVGLVVDRVLGSHQTVIQSLGRFYRDIEILSGATIMGDGRVALILDLNGLVRSADLATHTPTPSYRTETLRKT